MSRPPVEADPTVLSAPETPFQASLHWRALRARPNVQDLCVMKRASERVSGMGPQPAQRAGRPQPRAEVEGRCPGLGVTSNTCGPKGRETPPSASVGSRFIASGTLPL